MIRSVLSSLLLALLSGLPALAASNPVEVGDVRWARDFEGSLARSSETGRPVLVLFQEIPGCEGCQKFGREVLRHPLIVEAMEDLFHPVLVYNNRDAGTDRELLERFGEPAWNYQVIRFLDSKGEDVIPRKDRVWTTSGVAWRMIEALEATGRPVPLYLRTVAIENDADHLATAAFAMHCFWTGEMALGKIPGVVATEAGWMEGREVTRVTYDPSTIDLARLRRETEKAECADKTYAPGDGAELRGYEPAKDSDQKRQIMRWEELRALPGLTPMQLTKVNAFATSDMNDALSWLSPRQKRALEKATGK